MGANVIRWVGLVVELVDGRMKAECVGKGSGNGSD